MLCFFMDRWSQCRFWFLISKYSGVMYSLPPESLSWKPKRMKWMNGKPKKFLILLSLPIHRMQIMCLMNSASFSAHKVLA